MKNPFYFLVTLCALLIITNHSQAQITEGFESGSVTYVAGSYGIADLSSGSWVFSNASLGTSDSDKKRGDRSVRLDAREGKEPFITFTETKEDGISVVRFYYANYGSDTGGEVNISYSTDDGDTFVAAGDTLMATAELQLAQLIVNIADTVQIKISASGGARLNIDDIAMLDVVEAEEEATLDVFVDGTLYDSSADFYMGDYLIGQQEAVMVEIRNRGSQELNIDSAYVDGQEFNFEAVGDTSLGFLESIMVPLEFSTPDAGPYTGSLMIESNAVNVSSYELNISGRLFDVLPISTARQLSLGEVIRVAGRVTVADQFEGPVFIEDKGAGIAVYDSDLHSAVQIGDSIVVEGPLTEFNPIDGPEGDFLLQISTDEERAPGVPVNFDVADVELREVTPEIITVEQMNSGNFEAQLVRIQNATIDHEGPFATNDTNYGLSDGTGEAFIRIDGSTNLAGATAPEEAVTVVGVLDQFNGNYQLKPRFAEDLGVEAVTYPGENISKDLTFEVVTWNIEWFGDGSNGPDNESEQFDKVKQVITTIDADIYALQEIASTFRFSKLVDELEAYGGVLADYSQSQKTAYLFKRATIDSLDSGLITSGMLQQDWANGRYPLFFHFNADINGEMQEIYAFNIHAKAFDDFSSYSQRVDASGQLKQYLDNTHPADNVIFIGDYNDTMNGSITSGQGSPYTNFVNDGEYTVITKNLEDAGFSSQSSGSMIDHIMISSELADEYFEDTERIENTSYIGSYLSTTSDHYPVWTRFQFGEVVSNEEETDLPSGVTLKQNYPNPFNPSTVIRFELPEATKVHLQVFDVVGRQVATVANGRFSAGVHHAFFDASELASGIYIYQLTTAAGLQLSKKMLLLK
ncbi:MAG: T9SS type A sorting domain-containing protein [Balneolaceae bacterium]|nr:T9SS type A sorting domain-containing protein [Balneolaceae bacterium]